MIFEAARITTGKRPKWKVTVLFMEEDAAFAAVGMAGTGGYRLHGGFLLGWDSSGLRAFGL